MALISVEKELTIAGNRSRFEILASILNAAEHGTLKTHIMYKANLSHKQLEKYLAFLDGKGMLREIVDQEDGSRLYQITQKGTDFLSDYSRIANTYGQEILRK